MQCLGKLQNSCERGIGDDLASTYLGRQAGRQTGTRSNAWDNERMTVSKNFGLALAAPILIATHASFEFLRQTNSLTHWGHFVPLASSVFATSFFLSFSRAVCSTGFGVD